MNGDHRFERAKLYIDMGQTNQAVDLLAELLGDDPNEPIYHAVLASCLLDQKRLAGAEYELDVAQSLDPTLAVVYVVRSRLLLFQRKFDDALESCEQALQLNPEYVDALLVHSQLLRITEQRKPAFAQLQRAAALDPEDLDVVIAFGDYYNAYGDHQKALERAQEAMRINAGSADANVLMGETLLALGESAEADAHARYAVSQNPNNADALRLLVNVRMRENFFIGLWWRINSWATRLNSTSLGFVLIAAYVIFQLTSQITYDLGYETASRFLDFGWLALVLYSWLGIPIYTRALRKAVEEVQFNPKF